MALSRFQKVLIVAGILFVLGAAGAAYVLLRSRTVMDTLPRDGGSTTTGTSSPKNTEPLPLSATGTPVTSTSPTIRTPPPIPTTAGTESGTPPPRP